jgi:radical SAM superfamily enzyme YgiQ (UPF0313 family)
MMKQRGRDVEVYVEDLRRIDFDVVAGSDLVGISTITSTASRAYAIVDKARTMGIRVLMGGPHVTFLADEALEHADFVIRGEGEGPLKAFVDTFLSVVDLLKPKPGARISVDYREDVSLELKEEGL